MPDTTCNSPECWRTDLLYRFTGQSYSDSSRLDLNQVLSWNLRYRLGKWPKRTYLSYGDNRSNRSVFDYQVMSGGGGVGLIARF